jgi:hypothetical protein
MPRSDRVFRALARAEPATVVALLRRCARGVVPAGAGISPEAVDAPQLDEPPPPLTADWVARAGDDVLHVECQGYRDEGFGARLLWYHLALALRYRPRRVRSVALWLIRPPGRQRRTRTRVHDVTVEFVSIVLPERPAAMLLADARTACFAPAADAGTWTDAELCARVVRALRTSDASWPLRHMAAVAALVYSPTRFRAMVNAMDDAKMEPVIIEDLVKYGEDLGLERGLERGRLEAMRAGVLDVLDARGIAISDVERERIAVETSLERLRAWHRRAVTAAAVADVFGGE